ncbi:hypothetical protein QP266_28415, partial [Klebsiella oxytoca]|nr:hypothetical protein [Klebsiella oxytoca]
WKTGNAAAFLASLYILSYRLCRNVSVPSARRSRTTERSESVSEEAEYRWAYLWYLTRHSCIF